MICQAMFGKNVAIGMDLTQKKNKLIPRAQIHLVIIAVSPAVDLGKIKKNILGKFVAVQLTVDIKPYPTGLTSKASAS
jgi:hypothetical protein